LLNGASNSGKSTLAVGLQDALDEPFLHVSSDHLVNSGMLPRRPADSGPFNWWNEMRLAGLDVYLIDVHCALDEIDRREKERGDRPIGEGRTHVTADAIHPFGPYDLDVDTIAGIGSAMVASVVEAWRQRTPPGAL